MPPALQALLAIAEAFYGSNPTVQAIEEFLPAFAEAYTSAKKGEAFAFSWPMSVDADAGKATFSWAPNNGSTAG